MLNIFHDLRSPLFAVSSGLDTLARAPEALPTLLPALQQRMNFVRSLTEDLFLAAKLEQKQLLLNEDQVLLNEAAAAVCAACQPEAEKKGITLHAETATPLPVWGDQVRLQQVVQNLVTNAIHYTPVGGSVQVTCREYAGNALVRVQDTGYGIAPEDQKAVFDRYFHTTAQTKHDSTGPGPDHCPGACPAAPWRDHTGKRVGQRQLLHAGPAFTKLICHLFALYFRFPYQKGRPDRPPPFCLLQLSGVLDLCRRTVAPAQTRRGKPCFV